MPRSSTYVQPTGQITFMRWLASLSDPLIPLEVATQRRAHAAAQHESDDITSAASEFLRELAGNIDEGDAWRQWRVDEVGNVVDSSGGAVIDNPDGIWDDVYPAPDEDDAYDFEADYLPTVTVGQAIVIVVALSEPSSATLLDAIDRHIQGLTAAQQINELEHLARIILFRIRAVEPLLAEWREMVNELAHAAWVRACDPDFQSVELRLLLTPIGR